MFSLSGMAKQPASPSLFDKPAASPAAAQGGNIPEFSVGELSQLVKREIETTFGQVRVRGEVTQPKLHSSGHLYLTLKDENAVLAAVCWRGQVSRLAVKVEEGMELVATGRLTTYSGQSKYQMVIEQVALAGEGALLKMLEDRKKKLGAEGLFEASRKKPLPFLPQTIGVITSPTGAVIRDILHRLAERFPVRVLLWPVNVQGEGAAAQIAGAIAGFNALEEGGAVPRPDVLIVARGGGSLEDLLPFSEEAVVRAAANSRIPLISAVGHETDTTLIDYASDRRAPTPTAAAEMVVPVRVELLAQIAEESSRLLRGWQRFATERRQALAHRAARLLHPRALMETLAQKLDERSERLALAWKNGFSKRQQILQRLGAGLSLLPLKQNMRHGASRLVEISSRLQRAFSRHAEKNSESLERLGAMLESLSYQRVLQRGFVLVRGEDGQPVIKASEAKGGSRLQLTFSDGVKGVVVEK
jgi:exodeoxyribonuclease VII large subunit